MRTDMFGTNLALASAPCSIVPRARTPSLARNAHETHAHASVHARTHARVLSHSLSHTTSLFSLPTNLARPTQQSGPSISSRLGISSRSLLAVTRRPVTPRLDASNRRLQRVKSHAATAATAATAEPPLARLSLKGAANPPPNPRTPPQPIGHTRGDLKRPVWQQLVVA